MDKYLGTSCNAVPGTQYAETRYTQKRRGDWPTWQFFWNEEQKFVSGRFESGRFESGRFESGRNGRFS